MSPDTYPLHTRAMAKKTKLLRSNLFRCSASSCSLSLSLPFSLPLSLQHIHQAIPACSRVKVNHTKTVRPAQFLLLHLDNLALYSYCVLCAVLSIVLTLSFAHCAHSVENCRRRCRRNRVHCRSHHYRPHRCFVARKLDKENFG